MTTKHAIAHRHLHGGDLELTTAELEALAFVLPLSPDYPDIRSWFVEKVVPGLRCGSRHIVRIDRNNKIVALGIAKAEEETKICTVRVAPEFAGRGMGIRVFENLMSWLGTDRPLATVSENKLADFQRIFDHYGYRLTSVHTGLYRPGRSEFVFNEPNSPWGQPFPIK
ncbi:N-acetyltransferase [Rhodoblastus sp. 17X3]|uniref:N-acetyltransferase n=1 Tax=Rhodoblastus sp. 17X3 TaxID=3047026 RepID=UPI0024B85FC3|nr:N-acetyltransferase [Rhodoblastus sp. 17X3]MDI9849978.1 N-acetyltransferase [Rhodoblastus sp. 17X3]